jgi:preprotein translocase subunit SecF
MQIFRNTNFDFLGKRWWFIGLSAVLLLAGLVSLALKGGPKYGIDFKGGALMYVKFASRPQVEKIRQALSARVAGEISVQELTDQQEVVIGTELRNEKELNEARRVMAQTLADTFGDKSGRPDFNNAGAEALAGALREPLQRRGVLLTEEQLQRLVGRMLAFRDSERSGLLRSFDELKGVEGVSEGVVAVMKEQLSLAPFTVRQVEIVGPKVGADLRRQAVLATLYALGGMLVYIAFRFEWIYGVAAVAAVFHDVLVTVGFFSIFEKEISLTVIAALLTLVGYSMNDTIVVFDRVRENLKLMRRERFRSLLNISINQTLSRTILTSGLTFLTVLALLLWGGQVLNGFSFALTVGIIIGTYSSIFIASPIVLFWQDYLESRKRATAAAAVTGKEAVRKRSAKAVR